MGQSFSRNGRYALKKFMWFESNVSISENSRNTNKQIGVLKVKLWTYFYQKRFKKKFHFEETNRLGIY